MSQYVCSSCFQIFSEDTAVKHLMPGETTELIACSETCWETRVRDIIRSRENQERQRRLADPEYQRHLAEENSFCNKEMGKV